MKTGSSGTFVISWSQTETDGVAAASLDLLSVGVTWRWTGEPVRVDGPATLLRLDGAEGVAEMRRRAARVARRLVGACALPRVEPALEGGPDLTFPSFTLTDGYASFAMTLMAVPETGGLLALAVGPLPPVDRDLWVVHVAADRRKITSPTDGGVICFTPDTRILTPQGGRAIQTLRPGDLVFTRDCGAQPVLWVGQRHISGARLHAMPQLRPIRFRSGAFGRDRPEPDLRVSPQHRMLIKGRAAQALFSVDEVLVKAEDMVNDATVAVDYACKEVTYVHVLLEHHNIIWANGLETESFHPANAAPEMIDAGQKADLLAAMPALSVNPQAYGDFARRNLTTYEAAILRHDMPRLTC